MNVLWIDILCFESAIKTIGLCLSRPIEKIYYANVVIMFKPFIPLFSKIVRKPVVQILDTDATKDKLEGVSLYEVIQNRLINAITAWSESKYVCETIVNISRQNSFDQVKLREHFKEAAYPLLFRPIELKVLQEKYNFTGIGLFLMKKNPFSRMIQELNGIDNTFFYFPLFIDPSIVEKRDEYVFDLSTTDGYCSVFFRPLFRLFRSTVQAIVGSILEKPTTLKRGCNIGVELHQARVRLDEINEIYWLKHSSIKVDSVYAISFRTFDDDTSLQALANTGIKLLKNINPGKGFWFCSLKMLLSLYQCLFSFGVTRWLKFHAIRFAFRTFYWKLVYKKYGITILFTMDDVNPDKLAKAQAMEFVDGVFAGSHWSNYPLYDIENKKCVDVIFPWGEHFVKMFSSYPSRGVFVAGYPSDHYFQLRKQYALKLRSLYNDRFIISFQDQGFTANDAYTKELKLSIYNMLIDLLELDRVVLFFKPKKNYYFEKISTELPNFKLLHDEGRIKVFYGETTSSRAVPAEIGMASDLVIGQGISTAAAECCFAGTVSFYADFLGIINNEFANAGLNKIVFRDVDKLREAVIRQINGNGITVEECRHYHRMLDPFQDGMAYRRTGFVIEKLQEYFNSGLSAEEAIKNTKSDYDVFIKQKRYTKIH